MRYPVRYLSFELSRCPLVRYPGTILLTILIIMNMDDLAIRERESSFVIQAADLSKMIFLLWKMRKNYRLTFAETIGHQRNRVNLEKCTL